MLPEEWKKEIGDAIEQAEARAEERHEAKIASQNAIAAPLNRLAKKFVRYQREQRATEKGKKCRDYATMGGIYLAATVALIAIIITHLDSLDQIGALRTQLELTKASILSVERPLITIAMPKDMPPPGPHQIGPIPNVSRYGIVVENLGKQPATIMIAAGNYIIQESSDPPPLIDPQANVASFCPFEFMGEIIVRPNGGNAPLWCQRRDEPTAAEIQGINNGNLWGFFRASVVYMDTLGQTRNSIYDFLAFRPYGSSNFVQLWNVDELYRIQYQDEKKLQHDYLRGSLEELRKAMQRSGKVLTPSLPIPTRP